MDISRIDNENDDRLSEFRNVPDAELLTRLGLFVAEGRLVVARLLTSALTTRAVLVTEVALASLTETLTDQPVPVYVVPQAVMNAVGGFNFHRGCLALGVRPPARDWREIVGGALNAGPITGSEEQPATDAFRQLTGPERKDAAHSVSRRLIIARLVVLERVNNVDNIGSIFRNAAAFGVDGVLLQADCADPLYRKSIRTSMAAALTVPFATVPWPDALRELASVGWATLAMTPCLDAPLLHDVAATLAAGRVAIVLGHEGEGLTNAALAACTHRARIGMASGVDSVNVATAAAIALYEICNGVGGDFIKINPTPDKNF